MNTSTNKNHRRSSAFGQYSTANKNNMSMEEQVLKKGWLWVVSNFKNNSTIYTL
jgi:hypothetical protein